MSSIEKTGKFGVWQLDGLTSNNNDVKKVPKDNQKKVLVGARRVTLTDVVCVAYHKYIISLDDSGFDKKVEAGPIVGTNTIVKTDAVNDTDIAMTMELSRASIFVLIASLMQGRSGVRYEIIELLTNMLNKMVVPFFSSASKAGEELAAILNGKGGTCYSLEKIEQSIDLFSANDLNFIELNQIERNTLLYGNFVETAYCYLLVSGASNLFQSLDVIASLSCEVVGTPVDPFDVSQFELGRQHRGMISSSTNLRLLLDGSKSVNTLKSDIHSSFLSIPQYHGPALDAISIAIKTMEIELNSAETNPIRKPEEVFDQTQTKIIRNNITDILSMLTHRSRERFAILSTTNKGTSTTTSSSIDNDPGINGAKSTSSRNSSDIMEPLALLYKLSEALKDELNLSYHILQNNDSKQSLSTTTTTSSGNEVIHDNVDGDDDDDVTEKSKGNKKSKNANNNNNNNIDDSQKYTPEQLVKAEAKRKLKAEKAALKNKAKEAKRASATAGAIVLGAGTALLRKHLDGIKNNTNANAISLVPNLLNPFDVSETSFSATCLHIIEAVSVGGKRRPKIAKGARDYTPDQMRIREQAFAAIRRVFKRHGAVEIDTPVFELKEVLTGKYGEDSKLIYDLADQGGELLSLRYDLTVPFARFLAMNSVGNIKRFHIAKVYRRDNPQLAKGRYREFYQCDFDVAGNYNVMVPDAEVLTVATEILSELPIGPFSIKLNHRGILDSVFEICGVPAEKFRPICSAVDKLDKAPWSEVREEMVVEKGLSEDVADKIGEFVLHSGEPKALWKKLTDERVFGDHVRANAAMKDLKVLFDYLEALGSLQYISFDLSLARGLDYYTGVIYEAVLIDTGSGIQVGSIAAGGRYDNLVGMFSASGQQTPCVGVSVGIERVFAIMEKKAAEKGMMQAANIQVFVASIGGGLVTERMKVAKLLWNQNISAEYSHQDNPKFKKQLDDALERGIPYMVVFGEEEVAKGTVKIKAMREHFETEIPLAEMCTMLIEKGCAVVPAGADTNFITALKDI